VRKKYTKWVNMTHEKSCGYETLRTTVMTINKQDWGANSSLHLGLSCIKISLLCKSDFIAPQTHLPIWTYNVRHLEFHLRKMRALFLPWLELESICSLLSPLVILTAESGNLQSVPPSRSYNRTTVHIPTFHISGHESFSIRSSICMFW
jgi:hypothetical protein